MTFSLNVLKKKRTEKEKRRTEKRLIPDSVS